MIEVPTKTLFRNGERIVVAAERAHEWEADGWKEGATGGVVEPTPEEPVAEEAPADEIPTPKKKK